MPLIPFSLSHAAMAYKSEGYSLTSPKKVSSYTLCSSKKVRLLDTLRNGYTGVGAVRDCDTGEVVGYKSVLCSQNPFGAYFNDLTQTTYCQATIAFIGDNKKTTSLSYFVTYTSTFDPSATPGVTPPLTIQASFDTLVYGQGQYASKDVSKIISDITFAYVKDTEDGDCTVSDPCWQHEITVHYTKKNWNVGYL